MTSIHSLPPELLHQIFHWATYDYALCANFPSWKNYDLTYGDENGENPWPLLEPRTERVNTIKALRLACTRWTAIATELELRYIKIHNENGLKYYLGRTRTFHRLGGEEGNSVQCPVRIMQLQLARFNGLMGGWTEEDTKMVVSLIRNCPNLEVMVNWCRARREKHSAGLVVLQTLATACPKLKRLHWKPEGIMRLSPSSWASILASSSLATSLEVLEIGSNTPVAAEEPSPAPDTRLELPSLHCLQVSVDDTAPLVSVIAEEWKLPSLTSLYLQSPYGWDLFFPSVYHPTITPGVTLMVATHGQSVTTLVMDRGTALCTPLHNLLPAPIQELVYYADGLEETKSIPFTSLSTFVVLIDTARGNSLTADILLALRWIRKVPDYDLPELKTVVALTWYLDELKVPEHIDFQLLDEDERLLVGQWRQETPRLVNRYGVQLFTLVNTDQLHQH